MIQNAIPTLREKQILKMLAEGKSSKQIGSLLHISTHTVDTHRRNLIKRIHVNNSAQAVMKALKMGWVPEE